MGKYPIPASVWYVFFALMLIVSACSGPERLKSAEQHRIEERWNRFVDEKTRQYTEGLSPRLTYEEMQSEFKKLESQRWEDEVKQKEQLERDQVMTKPKASVAVAKLNYTIIKSNIVQGGRGLTVRLSRKASAEELGAIAMELKNSDPHDYSQTHIFYLTPGSSGSDGAWATTYFDPDLKVEILGLSVEQEAVLISDAQKPSQTVVGRWLDDGPYLGNAVTIYRENGRLYMERTFKVGSKHKDELVEKPSSLGRRFSIKDQDPSWSDYFLLDRSGNLQIRDENGLITTARKISPGRPSDAKSAPPRSQLAGPAAQNQ